ncbi:MAG: MerR family transcriptional regulator [Betaproteobacteria bacterium]
MNRTIEKLRQDFQGGAEALIDAAQLLVKKLNLAQEGSEGNERLLRHYVSIGVVDKPLREGRDALYGFRHLVQFLAARRLLTEGFSLAQIAKYTAVAGTDELAGYLEKTDRKSEAELLVAAFRSEGAGRSTPPASRKAPPPKPLPSFSTGMGMVDVMHEMRDMEQRVHVQLKDLQTKVHDMVEGALRGAGSRVEVQRIDPVELKVAVSKLANMMEEATQRFDRMLHKPMLMIEKQMEQQRYLFEQAHKQRDFLEDMFGQLLHEQRGELRQFFERQAQQLEETRHMQKQFFEEVMYRIDRLEAETAAKLYAIERHMQAQPSLPPSTPEPKEGAV